MVKLGFEADKTILANGEGETPNIKQQVISSLLNNQIEIIQNKVAKKIKEDKFIGTKSQNTLALKINPRVILSEQNQIEQSALKEESLKQIEVVKQYAENIAKWGISEGRNKMPNKLTSFQISKNVAGAIRTAMYNEAFIQISFAKGRELVEEFGKIPGGDVTPPSQKIQPRAQLTEPSIPVPR